MAEEPRSLGRRILGHPLAHLCMALLVLGLTQAFFVKLFMVPSGSMEQTLEVGDRVLVNRTDYTFTERVPEPGDLIVFSTDEELWPGRNRDPDSLLDSVKYGARWLFGDIIGIGPTTANLMVKRVIAVPGQTVECCGPAGDLVIDAELLDEPYIYDDVQFVPGTLDCDTIPGSGRCFPPVTVPEGMLLVLGDHRGGSSDGITPCRGSTTDSSSECVRWVRARDVIGEVSIVIWPFSRFGGVS